MATFLLCWKSESDDWRNRVEDVERVRRGQRRIFQWRCGHSKKIKRGDRVFLLKQGKQPRGIIAAGQVLSGWKPLDGRLSGVGRRTHNFVECSFEILLDHESQPILSRERLIRAGITLNLLNSQGSGIAVPDDQAAKLEREWVRHIGLSATSFDEADPELAMLEGEERWRMVRHRKREQVLREAKILAVLSRNGGTLQCEVRGCGFDFEERYGALGHHFAEVHHKRTLASREMPEATRLSDLAVVCCNCHAMIHRNGENRGINNLIPRPSRGRVSVRARGVRAY